MASPFTKANIKNMAYYFDDERIGIISKNTATGEWDSIDTTITPTDNNYLQIYYHSRYNTVNALTQDINVDIGIPPGMQTALIYYVKYRIAEDENDLRMSGYYWKKFMIKVKQYPYRKSGVRGISPYPI